VGLAHFSAQILFSLSAGRLADRHDRRRIATICQLIQASVATTLAIGSYQGWVNAITLDLFATRLGGATALLPIYARDILFTGPWGLGMLRAAPAIGAVLASAYLVRYPLTRNVGRIMFMCVGVFGAGTIVFGV
jgi:MFS family permease